MPLFGGDAVQGGQDLQLSAVYTALMTQRADVDDDMMQRMGRAAREPDPAGMQRRLSALDALNRERALVLLGEPGGGKSTFVNFVALCLAGEMLGLQDANLQALTAPLPEEPDQRRRDTSGEQLKPQAWDHGAPLPVRVVLRDFAARGLPDPGQPVGADTLWRFIVAELGEAMKD